MYRTEKEVEPESLLPSLQIRLSLSKEPGDFNWRPAHTQVPPILVAFRSNTVKHTSQKLCETVSSMQRRQSSGTEPMNSAHKAISSLSGHSLSSSSAKSLMLPKYASILVFLDYLFNKN